MQPLDSYRKRLGHQPTNARERWKRNTQNWLSKKLPSSLSYYDLLVDGEARRCAVLSTQNTNERRICTMPGETLTCGSYVEWMDNVWLIVQLDAPYEVYQGALMIQCNYLLKWINDEGQIVERWSIVNDGTKYLTGEYYQQMMTVGDSRVQLYIPKDEETIRLNRGRRFVIDNEGAPEPMVYELSKINRTGNVYNERGIYIHMLTETACSPDDNVELRIADYYSRIKVQEEDLTPDQTYLRIGDTTADEEVLVGMTYTAPVSLVVDGVDCDDEMSYELNCSSDVAAVSYSNGTVSVAVARDRKNVGTIIALTMSAVNHNASAVKNLVVKGWS